MKKRLRAVVGAVVAVTLTGQAFALGTASYSSELISTRSLGQGGTGVAGTQNDPVAVYTNPAALTSMSGTQIGLDLTYANARPTFEGSNGQMSSARATSVVLPSFAATTQFMDGRLAAGLALVTPYGLETHWNGDSQVRYAATDTRLRIIDVTPAVAYKVCEGFSIGVGADYYNAVEGALEHKLDLARSNGELTFQGAGGLGGAPASIAAGAAAAAASRDGNSRLNGNGDGWGYHVGTTIRLNENHQFGIVYHSSVKIGLTGNVQLTNLNGAAVGVFGGTNYQTDATAPVYIPQNVQVGYAYAPNENWMLEADAAWYDWYSARQLGVVFNANNAANPAVANQLLQSGNPQQFHPHKTLNYGVGANYKHSDALQLRGGFFFQDAALPEGYFDPAFADLPRYALTFGAGYALTKNLGLDAAYDAIFFHQRNVTAPSQVDSLGYGNNMGYSGNFSSFANIISASLTYRFDKHL